MVRALTMQINQHKIKLRKINTERKCVVTWTVVTVTGNIIWADTLMVSVLFYVSRSNAD